MPVSAIKTLAKKAGKEKDAEKLWKKAVAIAEDEKGKKEKDFNDKDYAYTMGVFKNILGIKESKINDFKEIVYKINDILTHKISNKKFVISSKEKDMYSLYPKRENSNSKDAMIIKGSDITKYFKESKKQTSFLECNMTAIEWIEDLFPTEEESCKQDEVMTSAPMVASELPENPIKPKEESEDEDDRDDRNLVIDDRDPLDR